MENTTVLRKVKVEGGYLRFTAAHFITFGGQCESLHGHNYGVEVELEGTPSEDHMVFDFTVLKHATRDICRRLNHCFLLPLRNPHLEVRELAESWEIRFGRKLYVLPREDVLALPIPNSTAECLAEHICNELLRELFASPPTNLHTIMVGVSEAPTQMAFYQTAFHHEP
jgi:6-pyruvoyl tetrahydropterin synthase/QueD family protein